jgi:hypothetical protein
LAAYFLSVLDELVADHVVDETAALDMAELILCAMQSE